MAHFTTVSYYGSDDLLCVISNISYTFLKECLFYTLNKLICYCSHRPKRLEEIDLVIEQYMNEKNSDKMYYLTVVVSRALIIFLITSIISMHSLSLRCLRLISTWKRHSPVSLFDGFKKKFGTRLSFSRKRSKRL